MPPFNYVRKIFQSWRFEEVGLKKRLHVVLESKNGETIDLQKKEFSPTRC